jgi:hypothetical protein
MFFVRGIMRSHPARIGLYTVLMGYALLSTGCASLSEKECKEAAVQGWQAIGEKDGRDGRDPPKRLAEHNESCAAVGVKADVPSYTRGWEVGMQQYCTPSRAGSVGWSGGYFNLRACIPISGASFASLYAAYVDGLESNVSNLQSDVRSLSYRVRSRDWSKPGTKEAKSAEYDRYKLQSAESDLRAAERRLASVRRGDW